jgi:endonuclease YncB( thermonuclease family)
MRKTEAIKKCIVKCIIAGKQFYINYTKSDGSTNDYRIFVITSTWGAYFTTKAESLSTGVIKPYNKFRYDKINAIRLHENELSFKDDLVDKVRDGTLFDLEDDQIRRYGGRRKGYPSSINFLDFGYQKIYKDEAKKALDSIALPSYNGWKRGILLNIEDGDTFDILVEGNSKCAYITRLYGADAPELGSADVDAPYAIDAKLAVEEMFADSSECYVQILGEDNYGRSLVNILNYSKLNVASELLKLGLALPMMAFTEDENNRNDFRELTREAYENELGIWNINELRINYNNVVSIPYSSQAVDSFQFRDKSSAIKQYMAKSPYSEINKNAYLRSLDFDNNKELAESIFDKMVKGLNLNAEYDLESFRTMCNRYVEHIDFLGSADVTAHARKDCILYIESMVDDLRLGDGEVKGNFSKGDNLLIYHDDPNNTWYKLCQPEIRFRSKEDAKYCGFRKN